MADFTPFREPIHRDDVPLVRYAGNHYECSGCGGPVPDGAWLHETIRDGMVTGLLVRLGPDGDVVHECGERDGP